MKNAVKKSKSQQLEILSENELLLREGKKIVEALGKMFNPSCEVVLHDLTKPDHSIVAIECALSGRKVGQPVTEMGLARIGDQSFPDIVQNYANKFPDGRPAKSTSVGLKNSRGEFVAAICLNMDVSLFGSMKNALEQLISLGSETAPVRETLRARSYDDIRDVIEQFATSQNLQPRALSMEQRQDLIENLNDSGLLQLRNGASTVADILGITRASVYNALKRSVRNSSQVKNPI